VCWPNGQICKIMNDVPNGSSQWVEEDIQPELYHPYGDGHVPPGGSEPPDDGLEARIETLEREMVHMKAAHAIQAQRLEDINARVSQIDADTWKKYDEWLPEYIGVGRAPVFGGNVTVLSKPKKA
jgi:hypothetical protein